MRKQAPQWSIEDDETLMSAWPNGYAAAITALTAAGLHSDRSITACYTRISHLRRDGYSIPYQPSGRSGTSAGSWSPAELAILTREYPVSGSAGTRAALCDAGHQDRSEKAIQARVKRARKNGLRIPARPPGPARDAEDDARTVRVRVTSMLARYGGMPLTIVDMSYELGASRRRLRDVLADLARENLVVSWDGPDGPVYKPTPQATAPLEAPTAVRAHPKPTRTPRKPHSAAQATP